LLFPIDDIFGQWRNCGLRHFTIPEQGQAKPPSPPSAAPHPRLEYHISPMVYTSVSTVSE
jgi:hypothetical protein